MSERISSMGQIGDNGQVLGGRKLLLGSVSRNIFICFICVFQYIKVF